MTSFIDKDQAAVLARALNRRRFGFFTQMTALFRATVRPEEKHSDGRQSAEHPADPLAVRRYQDRSA